MEKKFLEQIAEILDTEPDKITFDTVFREDCDFDSMQGFMMLVMIEEQYNKVMTVDEFLECKTIGDLYAYTQKQ